MFAKFTLDRRFFFEEVVESQWRAPVGEAFDEVPNRLADDGTHERRPETPKDRPKKHWFDGFYEDNDGDQHIQKTD